MNAENEIVEFVEKPTDPAVIESLRLSPEQLTSLGVADPARAWLASMGIYVFRQGVLFEALQEKSNVDFGKDLVPSLVGKRRLIVHPFTGYWEDIGTTRAFFEANIKLTSNPANFSFHHATFPIFTHPRALEGSIIGDATLKETIVAEGSRIGRATIEQAVIGIRSIVSDGARLKRVVLMGADYYEESQGGSYGVPKGLSADRHRRERDHRERDRGQERAHRRRRGDHERRREAGGGRAELRHPRRRGGHPEGRRDSAGREDLERKTRRPPASRPLIAIPGSSRTLRDFELPRVCD